MFPNFKMYTSKTPSISEFVQVAREIFKFQLEQKNISPGASFLPSSSFTQTFKAQVYLLLVRNCGIFSSEFGYIRIWNYKMILQLKYKIYSDKFVFYHKGN